jgi:hypothetical protein
VVFWKVAFGFDTRAVSWHRRSMATGVNVVLGLYIMETLGGLGSGREEMQDTLILIMISFLSKEGLVCRPRMYLNLFRNQEKGRADSSDERMVGWDEWRWPDDKYSQSL